MNFSTVSLLYLLSITSLVTSPASCMRADEDGKAKTPPVILNTSSTDGKEVELNFTGLAATFKFLREEKKNEASDEELAKYLIGTQVDWSTKSADQTALLISKVSGKSITVSPGESSDSISDKATRTIADIDREIEENGEKIILYTRVLETLKAKLSTLTEESGKKNTYQVYIERLEGLIKAGNKTLENLLNKKKMAEKSPS